MSRLRHFLLNLDPALWLSANDRWKLYSSHLCSVAIVKVRLRDNAIYSPAEKGFKAICGASAHSGT
jgi:hypothetical protein